MRLTLQSRFLAILTLSLLVALIALAVLGRRHEQRQRDVAAAIEASVHELVYGRLLRRADGVTGQLADLLAGPLSRGEVQQEQLGVIATAALRQPDAVFVRIRDRHGRLILESEGAGTDLGDPADAPPGVKMKAASGLRREWMEFGLLTSTLVEFDGETVGEVEVGFSLAALRDELSRASQQFGSALAGLSQSSSLSVGMFMLVLVGVGVGIQLLVWRGVVGPLRKLADAARQIESGQASRVRLDSRRSDEIGDLIRAFQRMSESVDRHDRDIRRIAYGDSLTGLPNRLALRERLDQRLLTLQAGGGELAMLFLDIDDFKRVNDTQGHDAGDELLAQFAQRLRQSVERAAGATAELARFGGDEFVVLTDGEDVRTAASRLADAIVQDLQRPITVQGRDLFLGVSIGVTLFPHDASSAGLLLKNGDIAMYQAKMAGKNCHRFYSRAMDQATTRRMQMEQDLRGAWERGEMCLNYQPVFRLGDGALIGAEALLRWQHPLHGMIPPSVFIEVAEQSGLIHALGRHVLAQACADAADWRGTEGDPPFVAVNISALQLRSGDLVDVVDAVLRGTGLAADRLHLELTETAVLGDEVQASAMLMRLRALGVKIWLDDFGTGFSGLSHLRRVPVDGVKIDRSFIADILRDNDDLALTSAIIAMAHSLGITVVAEGVENEGQFAVLRERRCDLAQGFWLGRPMPLAELQRRLAA